MVEHAAWLRLARVQVTPWGQRFCASKTLLRTSIRLSKMNSVSRAELAYQISTLIPKLLPMTPSLLISIYLALCRLVRLSSCLPVWVSARLPINLATKKRTWLSLWQKMPELLTTKLELIFQILVLKHWKCVLSSAIPEIVDINILQESKFGVLYI